MIRRHRTAPVAGRRPAEPHLLAGIRAVAERTAAERTAALAGMPPVGMP